MTHRVAMILMAALSPLATCLAAPSATAGPCAREIAAFRQTLERQERLNPDGVGTARQTIDAQLEHQPTPMSVERGREAARTEITIAVSRAEKLDSQGKQDECRAALDTARLLLDP
jgi:multidrug resistance efflux pump